MIGFTSTTFRQLNPSKIIALAKVSGAECIEWGGDIHVTNVSDAIKIKKQCDAEGIKISSYGSYYRVGKNEHDKWLNICEIASALGAKTIRVWLGTKGSKRTSNSEYANILADAREIADKAEQFSLIVAPECHANTYNDSMKSSLKFLKEVQRENVRTYFQSRYQDMKEDVLRLRATLPYVENVHLSFSEVSRMCFFMKKDTTCIPKIMTELIKADFGGCILLEYVFLARSKNFLKDMRLLRKLAEIEK